MTGVVEDQMTYTFEELATAANTALGDLQIADGRIADEVNVRTLRFYVSIGALDRGVVVDRRSMFGSSHLSRVLAIKRLQAAGWELARVASTLATTDDADLDDLVAAATAAGPPPPFWERHPAPAEARRSPQSSPAGTFSLRAVSSGRVVQVGPEVRVVFDATVDDATALRVHAAVAAALDPTTPPPLPFPPNGPQFLYSTTYADPTNHASPTTSDLKGS